MFNWFKAKCSQKIDKELEYYKKQEQDNFQMQKRGLFGNANEINLERYMKIDFMNGSERTYKNVYRFERKGPYIYFTYLDGIKPTNVTLRESLIACIEEYMDYRSNTNGTTTTTQANETNNSTSESA